jgi:hypothetical protein
MAHEAKPFVCTIGFLMMGLVCAIQCYMAARPAILEPIMLVELKAPIEFQGSIIGDINRLVWQQEISSAIPLLAEVEMLHNDYTMEL